MHEDLNEVLEALGWAVFRPGPDGGLRLVGSAPAWLRNLWPEVAAPDGPLVSEMSPFLANFMEDAGAAWQRGGDERAGSGLWLEVDAAGREHRLRATAFTAAGGAVLMISEVVRSEETSFTVLQKAREAALAYERLKRAEDALTEEKHLLEARVAERTEGLRTANAELLLEIVTRQRYAERLEIMQEADRAILAASSPEETAEVALRGMRRLLPYDYASVLELDSASRRVTALAMFRDGAIVRGSGWQLSSGQLLRAHTIASRETHRASGCANVFASPEERAPSGARTWASLLDVPLIVEGELVGVLNLASHSPDAFTTEHEKIACEIALQVAIALQHARLFQRVSQGREQLRTLSLRLVDAQEAERRYVASELHDEIGQVLTGLKLALERSADLPPDRQTASRTHALAVLDDLMHRVRQLSLDLRPQMLDDLGLIPALEWHLERYTSQTGIQVHFRHASVSGRLPGPHSTAAFRIAQEALTNAARHAGVTEVILRLWWDDARLVVQIEDQGVGFDVEEAATRASSGLSGMRERTEFLGGEFTVESSLGEGTRVTMELPLPVASAAAPPQETA